MSYEYIYEYIYIYISSARLEAESSKYENLCHNRESNPGPPDIASDIANIVRWRLDNRVRFPVVTQIFIFRADETW